jgi:hypothetical protein
MTKLSRRAVILIGVVALAVVPTGFQLMGYETARWDWTIRLGVLVAWLLAAVLAAAQAQRRDDNIDRLVALVDGDPGGPEVPSEAGGSAYYQTVVGVELLEDLLERRWPGIRNDHELTVFIWDPERNMLVPEYPRALEEPESKAFASGQGATGNAWESGQFSLVQGDDVSNDTYGLSLRQRRLFRNYRTVAAQPIVVNEVQIGVVGAISRTQDAYWADPRAREALRVLSTAIGLILVGSAVDDEVDITE